MYLGIYKYVPRENLNYKLAIAFYILGIFGFLDIRGVRSMFIWPMAGTVLILNGFLNIIVAGYVSVFPGIKKASTIGITIICTFAYLCVFTFFVLFRGVMYDYLNLPNYAVKSEVMYFLALMFAYQVYMCIGIKKPVITFFSLGVVAAVITSNKDITDYLLTHGMDDMVDNLSVYHFALLGYFGIILIGIFTYVVLRLTYNIPYPRRMYDAVNKQENMIV